MLKKKEHVIDIFNGKHLLKTHLVSIDTFITIGYVEKIVFLMMLLIQGPHSSTSRRNYVIDKEKQSIFWSEVDSFAD